jgi:hypothetical protein
MQHVVDMQEVKDIAFVKARTGMVHVCDPEALAAFTDGTGVFDIDIHCRKLDAFVAKHKFEPYQYLIEQEDLLPSLDPSSENRPVYYGVSLRRKRHRYSPTVA